MTITAKKNQTHEILTADITSQELSDDVLDNITGGAFNPGITEELFGSYNFILPHIEQENVYIIPRK